MVNRLWIANPILYFGAGSFTGYVLESNKISYSLIDFTVQSTMASFVSSSEYYLSKRAKRSEETGDIIWSNVLGFGSFYLGELAGRAFAIFQYMLPVPTMLV